MRSRCRRRAGIAALAALVGLAACGEREREPAEARALQADAERADPMAAGAAAPAPAREAEEWAAAYYAGYLAETLRGDVVAAREAYEGVIARAGATEPEMAARAALRLAEIEALAGRRRQAIELVARAAALGRDSVEIVEQADALQARLTTVRAEGSEVRGPPAGTELEGASEEAAARFRKAEQLLAAYHQVRLTPQLEAVRASVRAKEQAMEAAARAYRHVASLEEPAAIIAAEFRGGSLYHDLAIALMFDLPPELEAEAAARLRRSLRASALGHLRKARAAYERCLQEAGAGATDRALERWVVAAERGLRSVEDLLSGRE